MYLDMEDNLDASTNKRHLSSQNTSHQVRIPFASEVLPTRVLAHSLTLTLHVAAGQASRF